MGQADLVAAVRAYEDGEKSLEKLREARDIAIRQGITSGEWKIVDVVRLTGLSRETIRKIAYPKD